MPELEGQAATQQEYLSAATPPDCEETNWHSVGLQKTVFSDACFKSEAFRHLPIFHANSFRGDGAYARRFIKPPRLPEYLGRWRRNKGHEEEKKKERRKTSAIYCKGTR